MKASGTRPLRPPGPGTLRPFSFPPFRKQTLGNGLQVRLAPYGQAPLVQIAVVLPAGGQHDPPDKAGLASLTASALDEGTEDASAMELAERAESLGGYLTTQADWDALVVSVEVLSSHFAAGLELLAEVVMRASFPEQELIRLRRQRLAELLQRSAQPSALAGDALADLLYRGSPYGKPLLGDPEGIQRITRDDVLEFARRHIRPSDSTLIVVGDVKEDAVTEQIASRFANWQGERPPPRLAIDGVSFKGLKLCVIDRPDAAQTELRLGHVGIPRGHTDQEALQLLNTLLGGKFTSRINLNLRERMGITYGAFSSLSQRLGPGPFVVGASVSTDSCGIAVKEILGELTRLCEKPVNDEELRDTKNYVLGVFPYTLQRIEGLAARLAELAVYDLPDHYFESFPHIVEEISSHDMHRVARQHLHPQDLAVVAVGPAAALQPQLEPFGQVDTRSYADMKSPLDDPAAGLVDSPT